MTREADDDEVRFPLDGIEALSGAVCAALFGDGDGSPAEGITRAAQLAEVAGVLSRIVGGVAALECAKSAVQLHALDGTPLCVATMAALAHRHAHWRTYGAAWAGVTPRQIDECARAVAVIGAVAS